MLLSVIAMDGQTTELDPPAIQPGIGPSNEWLEQIMHAQSRPNAAG